MPRLYPPAALVALAAGLAAWGATGTGWWALAGLIAFLALTAKETTR